MAQQIQKKYIGAGQVGSSQILIEKNSSIKIVDQSDAEVDLLKLNGDDEIIFSGPVNLQSRALKGLQDAVNDDEAIPKGQFDLIAATFLTLDGSLAMQGDLDLNGFKITGLGDPSFENDAVNKGQLDLKLDLAGGTMSGDIDLAGFALKNVASAIDASDPVIKSQWDLENAKYLQKDGSVTAEGNLNLGNYNIISLKDGVNAQDAVTKAQLDTKLSASLKGAANGLAELDSTGKIPTSQLPAVAISDTFVVTSEAEMLALPAQKGDVAVRTDVSKSFILLGSSASTLADWQELLTPGGTVSSVNGQTGAVSLDTDDIAEGLTNHYFTEARAKSAAVADALVNGVVDVAPSQNAVFDALATKQNSLGTGTTSQYLRGDLTWQTITTSIPKIYTVGVDANTIAGCIALCTSPSATNCYIVQIPPGSYTEDLTIPGCVGLKSLASPQDNLSVKITGSHTIFGTAVNPLSNRVWISNILFVSAHATNPIITISGTTDTEVQISGCYFQNSTTPTTTKILTIGANGRVYIRNSRTALSSVASNGGTHFVLAGGTLYVDGTVDSSGGICGIDMTVAGYAQVINSTFTVSGANVIKVVAGGSVAAGYSSFTNTATVGNGVNLLGLSSALYATYCNFNIIENASSFVVTGGAGSAYLFFANSYSHIPGVLTRNIKIGTNVSQLRYANSLLSSDISDFASAVRTAALSDAIADGVVDKAPTQNAVFDALALKINSSLKGAVNGVAELDSSGKVPASQLPAISITDTFVVGSEAAMLALSAHQGDVAVRTDVSKTFILAGTNPAILASWQELLTPGDAILSVNGQTGVVTLDTDDIAEGSTNQYFTAARAKSAIMFQKEKFTLTSTDITNQYVDLPDLINETSLMAFNMRLALHFSDDYTLSTVGGVTRFTFAGDSATGGSSPLMAGDVLRFSYVLA